MFPLHLLTLVSYGGFFLPSKDATPNRFLALDTTCEDGLFDLMGPNKELIESNSPSKTLKMEFRTLRPRLELPNTKHSESSSALLLGFKEFGRHMEERIYTANGLNLSRCWYGVWVVGSAFWVLVDRTLACGLYGLLLKIGEHWYRV